MDGRRSAPKGSSNNAHLGAAAAGGTNKRKGKRGGGGSKKPIKVVYIGNPMRVTTSAEGFRALVQELTGRHAVDPSKHSGGGAIDVDDYVDSSGGSLQAEPQISPGGSTEEGSSSADVVAAAAVAGQVPPTQAPSGFDDDDEESFMPQLIDNSYAVFSPPTFLYGHHYGLL